jgi:hypothetical protein
MCALGCMQFFFKNSKKFYKYCKWHAHVILKKLDVCIQLATQSMFISKSGYEN